MTRHARHPESAARPARSGSGRRRAGGLAAVLTALAALSACDQVGIETPAAVNARHEAEGKAIGGACRHAGREIEDCYTLNKKGDKAAIFAGWREMNDYMRENKIDAVAPQLTAQTQTKPAEDEAPEPEPPARPAKAAGKTKHGA